MQLESWGEGNAGAGGGRWERGRVGEARTRILRSRRPHWFPCEMTSSFRGEAVGGVAKCRLVSQATESSDTRARNPLCSQATYPYGG